MNMKAFITKLFLAAFITGCTSQEEPNSLQSEHGVLMPDRGTYAIELIDFAERVETKLSQELNAKTFNIHGIEISNNSDGHTFFLDYNTVEYQYVMRVRNVSTIRDTLEVNIQIFKNEAGEKRRILNPGNFNIPRIKIESEEKSEIGILKDLIIALTYK